MKELDEQDLLDLKSEIDDAKEKVSELKGQKTVLLNQLKTDYGCKTIEEAEKKLRTMKKEIESLDEQIEDGLKELEEKYEK